MKLIPIFALIFALTPVLRADGERAWDRGLGEEYRRALRPLSSAESNAPTSGPDSVIELEASQENKKAAAQIGFGFGDLALIIRAETAFDEGTKEVQLANLDGLTRGTSASATANWTFWNPTADVNEQGKLCKEYQGTLTPDKAKEFHCSYGSLPTDGEWRSRWDDVVHYGTIGVFGLQVKANRATYKFFDQLANVAQKQSRSGYAASIGGGALLESGWYLGLKLAYERRYETGDKATVCTPLGAGPATQCGELYLAAPVRKSATIATAEFRKHFGERLAISPRLSRDFRADVTGVEIPVYFLRKPDEGLRGGVKVGWRSDNHEVTATVFIGERLGLIAAN